MDKEPIVATRFKVSGVTNDNQVKEALQELYDIFSENGMGQATFEITGGPTADLFIKHKRSMVPDRALIEAALARAGDYQVVGEGESYTGPGNRA